MKKTARTMLSQASFGNFFNNTLEGIFRTSPEGKLLAANPALARICGHTSARELLKNLNDLNTQFYVNPKRRKTYLRIMRKRGYIANFESEIYRKDGSVIWIKENSWTIRDKYGTVRYFEGTVHDISVRKRTEEERERLLLDRIAKEEAEKVKEKLIKLYEQAQEGIRARDEFLNIASHELRTPLTSLKLQIQLLQRMQVKETNSARFSSSLSACELQIKRLAKLINNLLDVSRISNKKLILEKEKTNLSSTVKEVLSRFEDTEQTTGSRINFVNGKPIVGLWDKSKIDQVATNLIANALKYGNGKPILVKIDKKHNKAELIVQDKGIGIEVSDLKQIFNRFARSQVAKKYGGLGLGLYITQQIVNAHGGTISVKSTPEKGSKFTVKLPLED